MQLLAYVIKPVDELVVGVMIKDRLGQPIFGTNTFHTKQVLKDLRQGERIQYTLRFPANFGEGSYSMSFALHDAENHLEKNYEWRDLALVFEVINADKDSFVGLAWLPSEMECRR